METWKHLTIEHRKVISNGISHNYKLKEIAENLGFDPTSISKEVKRNRDATTIGKNITNCKRTNRWPYVCTGCNKKYNYQCTFTKYKYVAQNAQIKSDIKLINSRKGIDIDSDEFIKLDNIIKDGIDNKKYEYSENKEIDRTGHTYIDYLSYIHKHPGIYVWQLDFLGTIKSDNNNILSFVLPDLQLPILTLIKDPNQKKVVEFFDELEERIGTNAFIELIPVILTDRDPNFTDINGICFSKITGEERCKLFFCDAYVSNQKPNVENMNKQLRLFFPKGKTIDTYTKKDIKNTNLILLNRPLKSLDSFTPKEAFINIYDVELFNKLF